MKTPNNTPIERSEPFDVGVSEPSHIICDNASTSYIITLEPSHSQVGKSENRILPKKTNIIAVINKSPKMCMCNK